MARLWSGVSGQGGISHENIWVELWQDLECQKEVYIRFLRCKAGVKAACGDLCGLFDMDAS